MPTFDATVGSATATSLATRAFAADYFAVSPAGSWWASKTQPEQESLLMQGTMRLEAESWRGTKAVAATQALSWPRAGCTDRDGAAIATTVIPKEVGYALCEVIAQYKRLEDAGTDPRAPNDLSQFASVTAGDISITMADADVAPVTDGIPTAAKRWVAHLLKTGSMFGKVVR